MKKSMKRLKKHTDWSVAALRENSRYLWIAGIFLLAVYYNLAIAVPPESPDTKKEGGIMRSVTVDIDRDHPLKRYDHVALSRKGDWYRVGLVMQSLDEDESLRVSLASSAGKTQEIGFVDVKKDGGEKYFEFTFAADGSYEDIVIEKVREGSDESQWGGGHVRLADIFVSRLDIAGVADAKQLQSTVFGEKDALNLAMTGSGGQSDVKFPHDAHFIQGQIFDVSDDAYALFANMRIKQLGSVAGGKYRLELRFYDSITKKVSDQVLHKTSFSAKDLKSMIDTDGSYRLDLPYRLEAGKSYFLGVSDDYVKPGKRIQLDVFRSDDGASQSIPQYFAVSAVKQGSSQVGLLTHAVIEDLGASFRYQYRSNHAVTDMMDLFAASDKVSFDSESSVITGKESAGTFFTYKINTLHPFEDFRVEATQLGNDDNQIRVEYSFDNAFWKEILVTRTDKTTKSFDELLHGDKSSSAVYVRVSYAGSKDGSGAFGLSDFRVTATMPKEATKKLSR